MRTRSHLTSRGILGMADRNVPAIVLGSDVTGLGALRCLAMAGIPAYVACPEGDLATRSRWFRATPGTPWDGKIGRGTEEALRAMPLDEAVLIPGADDAALWLADLPAGDLAQKFHVSTSSRRTLEILQDKTEFARFLLAAGIPHPRTYSIASAEEIDAIPFDELDRVFIKPANSQRFSQIIGKKGIWVHSRQELADIWRRLDGQGFKLMAQEYVPGTSADHYFIDGFRDRDGRLTGLLARRRIRIFPPDFGNSSYCVSIPLEEIAQAVESITRLLSELRYRGIFSAEFKRDARNGDFRILEVNTRAWWYVEFAALCGVNVCEMAYQDALGLPVTVASRDYRTGKGCVNLYGDIKTVLAQDTTTRDPIWRILGQWARSHTHAFRFRDPAPGLSIVGGIGANYLRRFVGRKPPQPREKGAQ
jgi:predicted ATP-grasp superfamily ATP-dependent carboligase